MPASGAQLTLGRAAPVRVGRVRRLLRRNSTVAFLMCLPLILLIALLVVYPALYAIYLAMLNKSNTTKPKQRIAPWLNGVLRQRHLRNDELGNRDQQEDYVN